jgi:hypothetical protein
MGLNAALVDRARPVRKASAGIRVGGTHRYAGVRGDWFRCRLELGPAGLDNTAPATHRKGTRGPSAMLALLDERSEPVAVSVEDRLEIDSPNLGQSLWDVIENPEPIRKKRRVIGWQVRLRRVEDRALPDAVQP